MVKRDILSVLDMRNDLERIVDLGLQFKRSRYSEIPSMKNRVLGMIFEKPSTRTRISLETAMVQMGGHAIYLNPNDMQMGRGETIEDTARVLSGFLDAISYRAFSHQNVARLARYAKVPVINALDDEEHPLQIVADLMTIKEHFGYLRGLNFTYVGDGNNMANSLLLGMAITGVNITVATPKGYEPGEFYVKKATEISHETGSRVSITNDPVSAVKDADVVYTDVWVSMGQEKEREEKEAKFREFQVNEKLVSNARRDFIFMHCLPAHRGLEVTDGVADSINSVIFQQAENRLHSAKAVLYTLIGF